jgi:hypothetical protein
VVDNVLGVRTYSPHECRAQRVKEEEPDEVEAGTGLDDAPIVDRDAVVGEEREIDPLETRCESSAPNDI